VTWGPCGKADPPLATVSPLTMAPPGDTVDAAGVADPFAFRIATNISTACAVLPDGRISCWGSDLDGVLGDGTVDNSPGPVLVNGVQDALAVGLSNGAYTSTACALRKNGKVACWGGNAHGELGDGTTRRATSPVEVQGISDAEAVFAGSAYTCVRRAGGALVCFGDSQFGQLGTDHGFLAPTTVKLP